MSPKPFAIVKPHGNRYLEELEDLFQQNHLFIKKVYFISDWETTARSIYAHQLDSDNQYSKARFESDIWINRQIFGNHALVLIFQSLNEESIEKQIEVLHSTKDQFRNKIKEMEDNKFTINVKIGRFLSETLVESSKISFGNKENVFYLKYIHSPGDFEELLREWSILANLGIFAQENEITPKEWGLLKFLRCVTPPSRYNENKPIFPDC